MKTPDEISKKKQKLCQEIEMWVQRENSILATLIVNPEESVQIREKAAFCRQEAKKQKKALLELIFSNRTPRQVHAGWK